MKTPAEYEREQSALEDALASVRINAGEAFTATVHAGRELTTAQVRRLSELLAGYGVNLESCRQRLLNVATAGRSDGTPPDLAQFGDVEYKIAGVPAGPMPAVMALGYVLRSLALAGAAAFAVAFAWDNEDGTTGVAGRATDFVDKAKWPLLLLLLVLVAIYVLIRRL